MPGSITCTMTGQTPECLHASVSSHGHAFGVMTAASLEGLNKGRIKGHALGVSTPGTTKAHQNCDCGGDWGSTDREGHGGKHDSCSSSIWLSERQALTALWTHQFLFILAPHAITGSSSQALWHVCFLDLVNSSLTLVGLAPRTRLLT